MNIQLGNWMDEYNECPHTALRNCYGKQKFQSPQDKRTELLDLLQKQLTTIDNAVEITARFYKDVKQSTQRVTLQPALVAKVLVI